MRYVIMLMIIACMLLNNAVMAQTNVKQAQAIYPFQSVKKRQQFERLSRELRCLVCQNENLASSSASLAAELRKEVYEMVKQGRTDKEIKHYMVARYGDFVLFKPPLDARTYLLWFGPFVLLVIGFIVLFRVLKKRK